MPNSDESVNSKGVLLFAFNTEKVNYVEIAIRTAKLIKRTLNLPVALCTDVELPSTTTGIFEHVIISSNDFKNVRLNTLNVGAEWRNGGRYSAYDITPFEQTILIDSDVLVLDKNLLKLLDTTEDYKILGKNRYSRMYVSDKLGSWSIPFQWATVIVFKKTLKTKCLFEMVERIQNNYRYYTRLYGITTSNFRNDYAFTIANNIINGHTLDNENIIPWPLTMIEYEVKDIELIGDNKLIVRNEEMALLLPKHNLHVLDKMYLLSDGFKTLLEKLCQ